MEDCRRGLLNVSIITGHGSHFIPDAHHDYNTFALKTILYWSSRTVIRTPSSGARHIFLGLDWKTSRYETVVARLSLWYYRFSIGSRGYGDGIVTLMLWSQRNLIRLRYWTNCLVSINPLNLLQKGRSFNLLLFPFLLFLPFPSISGLLHLLHHMSVLSRHLSPQIKAILNNSLVPTKHSQRPSRHRRQITR